VGGPEPSDGAGGANADAEVAGNARTDTVDEITQAIGYENSSTFRKLFKKCTGLSLRGYRNKFALRAFGDNAHLCNFMGTFHGLVLLRMK